MQGGHIGALFARLIQLVSGAVVLGLSVWIADQFRLSKQACYEQYNHGLCDQAIGRWPSSSEYSAFTGAFGLLDVLIGVVAVFVTSIPFLGLVVVDVLAAIFYLAGGVNMAVLYSRYTDYGTCPGSGCTRIKADIAFSFIGLVSTLVGMGLHFMGSRGIRSSPSRV